MAISSFREQVLEDFHNVLGNPEEYGAFHQFNGRKLQMVVSAAPAETLANHGSGTLQEAKEIICSIDDMPNPPRPTETVELDGVKYAVVDFFVEFVFVHISLARLVS
ncbi:MAG: hypothetical protein LBS30_01880 [Planctomycetota bacterium]|jgi:hypothetical protein|nr:hypothetical protein [Planctomycetota bacterium]